MTASVLAQNKKSCLSECATPEIPLTLLPTSFSIYDLQTPTGQSGGAIINQMDDSGASTSQQQASCSTINIGLPVNSNSPSKSVIVRAGPSVGLKNVNVKGKKN